MFSPGTSSRWAAPLRGILIGVGFFLVGSLSDIWLHQHFAKLSIELMVDALVGIGAGLLAFVYDRRQRRNLAQREQAMNALRESEERFRLVANSAPVLIWMSGPDKLCTFFNQGWLDFTGRSIEQELGQGWASINLRLADLEIFTAVTFLTLPRRKSMIAQAQRPNRFCMQ